MDLSRKKVSIFFIGYGSSNAASETKFSTFWVYVWNEDIVQWATTHYHNADIIRNLYSQSEIRHHVLIGS
jgi:hypothetical protein